MSVKVNRVRTLHKLNLFTLVTESITLPNGHETDVHILRHPGAAAVVPVTDSGALVMIRQYRHAVGGLIWEIPAGTLEPGESALACARRELAEETGYTADEIKPLGQIAPVPAWSDERIDLFLATGLTPVDQSLEKDEWLEVHVIGWQAALAMIAAGSIRDAKTIAAICLARPHLSGA